MRQPSRHGGEAERAGQQHEVEDDGAGLLGHGQQPHLDRGEGRAAGAGQAERRADRRAGLQALRERAAAEMRREHDQHADEADRHRAPAIDAHALLEHERRQHDDGRAARHSRVRRHPSSGRNCRAAKPQNMPVEPMTPRFMMAAQIVRLERARQFGPPCQPDQQRDQREEGAEEDELARRIARRDRLDAGRHQREGQRRDQLEADAEKRGQRTGAVGGEGRSWRRLRLVRTRPVAPQSVKAATPIGGRRGRPTYPWRRIRAFEGR